MTTAETYVYPATSNRMRWISVGGSVVRDFSGAQGGEVTGWTIGGVQTAFSLSQTGRIIQVRQGGTIVANYRYDAKNRLSTRQTLNMTPAGTTHVIHDDRDRVIAETNGAGVAVREYIWLDDWPVAVLDGSSSTSNPTLLWVHADHLKRPELMTDASKAVVWKALYEPFGAVHSVTGTAALAMRFPGQWFQLEAGLHYNWHRHYDPTTGRYTQPDPLGLEALRRDGPSAYAYAYSDPQSFTDPEGQLVPVVTAILGGAISAGLSAYADHVESNGCTCDAANPKGSAASATTAVGAGVAGFVVGDSFVRSPYPRPGAGSGTSIVSSYLSGLFPQRTRRPWPAPTGSNLGATSRVAGRIIGRWLPFVGAATIGYDIGRIARCFR